MDVKVLRNFVQIVELQSLSAAAAKLNVAQPALSRQIRLLEEELGTLLFVRHRKGVTLTEAGHYLCERAKEITAIVDATVQSVSAIGKEPTGPVSLALGTALLHALSGALVENYCRRYPRAALRVHEVLGHRVEGMVRDGLVDVAILISPKPILGLTLEPLAAEQICIAGPLSAGLRLDVPVAADFVARVPMVMFSSDNKVRQAVEARLSPHGLRLNPMVEVEGGALSVSLVERGVGYTLLPLCAIRPLVAAGRISAAPIDGVMMEWKVGVARTRATAPAVAALVALIREQFSERIVAGVWDPARPETPARTRTPNGNRRRLPADPG